MAIGLEKGNKKWDLGAFLQLEKGNKNIFLNFALYTTSITYTCPCRISMFRLCLDYEK